MEAAMRLVRKHRLEQRLIDYVRKSNPDWTTRLFECGPEFGVAIVIVDDNEYVEWHAVEECPVEIPAMPKRPDD